MSRKEAAGELGLSPDSVRRLVDNRELEAIRLPKMGGKGKNVRLMFEPEAIKRFKERLALLTALKSRQ